MALGMVQGLRCPSCGGPVPVEEGRTLTRCGGCEVSLVVEGMEGHPRYYVPNEIEAPEAYAILAKWWRQWGHAFDLRRRAELEEAFLVYLPFWRVRTKIMGWVFGEKKHKSKNGEHWVHQEKEILMRGDLTVPACAIQEFGVRSVDLQGDEVRPLDLEAMERDGMVFQAVFPADQAVRDAESMMEHEVEKRHGLDRISYQNVKTVSQRVSLVYYPLWVMRYRYAGRTYQAMVDGEGRKVIYGRAPGNDLYRACLLVGSMALGNFLLTTAGALMLSSGVRNAGELLGFLILGCVGMMYWGFHQYRHGGEVLTDEANPQRWMEMLQGFGV